MNRLFPRFTHRQRLFSMALVGCACATLPAHSARAQGTPEAAAVSSSGVNIIETSGVYPTTANGANHYIDAGAAGSFPSFAVLDFSVGSYGLNYPVTSLSSLALSLTEADYAGSKAGSFTIYLTEDTNSIATANGGSPLKYLTANSPSGLGTQLGDPNAASPTLFSLGTFTSDASTTSTQTDTFNLTLSSAAQSYFLQQLNGGSADDLRLVIASNDTAGYATFLGNGTSTITVPAASQPTLSFSAVLNTPTLAWKPGGATGGSGTWLPAGTAGDTSWNGGPWDSTKVAQFAGTGGTVAIGTGGVSATGMEFDTTSYVLGTTTGPSITLTSSNGTSAPTIQVTNATDTATINAPIAGTAGLNKAGAGTLVLGGTNTYTGGTTLGAGTLQISADANLGDASGGITLNGGTLHPVGSLTTARAIGGAGGGIQVDSGATLTTSGVLNATSLTLPGAGTLALTNSSGSLTGGASNQVTGTVTLTTAGATLTTADLSGSGTVNGNGIINLGGISATQASGAVTVAANANVTGTVTINVANSGATLNLPGGLAGAAVIAKTGAGTLVLGAGGSIGNSGLTGTGTTAASFRQGTAGATPVSGGTISIGANNPDPNNALGVAQFQANGGTLSNDSGQAVTLPAGVSISLGAQNAAGTPGGLVFAGSNPITVTGGISLYKAATNAYQHTITVNTPTTFTGVFALSAAGTSLGVTFAGSSTLTLAGTTANAFTEPVTIATSGANAGVTAAADGSFAANTSITLNANAHLTISTGAVSGTANAINDAALVSFASTGGAFGKITLSIGTAQESVGGLYLAVADGTLPAGYLPAGTYGSSQSNATYKDNTLFSGTGVLYNAATAVPEPSALVTALAGVGLAAGRLAKRKRRK